MRDWKKEMLDDETMWPEESLVDLPEPHTDARGSIQSLVNLPMKNASLISSTKGALRSNHYHKTDWHFMYVMSGSFDYYYRPTGSTEAPAVTKVEAGGLIFTPPMEDHATIFLEDCTMLVMSRNPRDQESYESDVVRVTLVDPAGYIL
jgi:oxalate decarboxylase/phosphoglucose isomerase-like protein (cupin superfamily)